MLTVYANVLFVLSVGTITILLLAYMTVSVILEELDDSDTELEILKCLIIYAEDISMVHYQAKTIHYAIPCHELSLQIMTFKSIIMYADVS